MLSCDLVCLTNVWEDVCVFEDRAVECKFGEEIVFNERMNNDQLESSSKIFTEERRRRDRMVDSSPRERGFDLRYLFAPEFTIREKRLVAVSREILPRRIEWEILFSVVASHHVRIPFVRSVTNPLRLKQPRSNFCRASSADKPIKMIEGWSSRAAANKARTNFSPSPTWTRKSSNSIFEWGKRGVVVRISKSNSMHWCWRNALGLLRPRLLPERTK